MKNEEDLSESEKKKLRKEKERKEYYVKYLGNLVQSVGGFS